MQPIGHVARVVPERTLSGGDLAELRIQLVADAGIARGYDAIGAQATGHDPLWAA